MSFLIKVIKTKATHRRGFFYFYSWTIDGQELDYHKEQGECFSFPGIHPITTQYQAILMSLSRLPIGIVFCSNDDMLR